MKYMPDSEQIRQPSTSEWRRFVRVLFVLSIGAVAALFAALSLIDPYDSLPLSLQLQRFRVTGNERYAFPRITRDPSFDSAVFGTSTSMLLKPSELNARVGGTFANLAMGSARAWEQAQLMKLFARNRSDARTVVLGLDIVWCTPTHAGARLTFRPFPPWQYNANVWDDYLHLLNIRVIAHSARLIAIWTGLRRPRYPQNGYFQFVPDTSEYDRERALENIYGDEPRLAITMLDELDSSLGHRPSSWTFPDSLLLEETLLEFPDSTRKILFFAANHASQYNLSYWQQFHFCKQRVVEIAERTPNTIVLDLMFPSEITTEDERYWDPLHYTVETATRIVEILGVAARHGRSVRGYSRILWPPSEE